MRGLLLLFAALLPVSAGAARALRQLLGAIQGTELAPTWQLAGAGLVLLPSALLAGALFRVAARAWLDPQRSLAQAYGLESVGALLGGAISSGLVLLGASNLALAMLTASVVLPSPGRSSISKCPLEKNTLSAS